MPVTTQASGEHWCTPGETLPAISWSERSSAWCPILIFVVVMGMRQRMSVGRISSITPLLYFSTFCLLYSNWSRVHVMAQCWEIACFDISNMISQIGHFSRQSLHLFHHQHLGSEGHRKR
uniref:Uncharacterized protein n=1 Tax=Romanomermis culicivorax TaxID=13658 RepID=A0A915J2F1_ROMCU